MLFLKVCNTRTRQVCSKVDTCVGQLLSFDLVINPVIKSVVNNLPVSSLMFLVTA
jgi:hypothetical protein